MDKYAIDGHKLNYHPQRIAKWLDTGDCFPIYVEISPSGKCNHRCVFCALDYMGYDNPLLDPTLLMGRLIGMKKAGVKAVMFGGEGEPLLHPNIGDLIFQAKNIGLDVSVTTNGVLLDKILPYLKDLEWVRVSIDAGNPKTYSEIHQTKEEDFGKVIGNITRACNLRKERGLKVSINAQMLLLQKNWREVEKLAHLLNATGADYLSFKPYSKHPDSKSIATPIEPRELNLADALIDNATNWVGIDLIFRRKAFGRS
ncbi:hypothetical protein LCGC14_0738640, partial [marine sediment metagenome]